MALEMRTHGQTYEAVIKVDNQDVANLNANINPENVDRSLETLGFQNNANYTFISLI